MAGVPRREHYPEGDGGRLAWKSVFNGYRTRATLRYSHRMHELEHVPHTHTFFCWFCFFPPPRPVQISHRSLAFRANC